VSQYRSPAVLVSENLSKAFVFLLSAMWLNRRSLSGPAQVNAAKG
jgi:hypothetical protein